MVKISKIAAVFPSKTTAADEKALAKCFDEMLATQKDIDALLVDIGKAKPLPAVTKVELNKRQTIAKSRAAEMKDMTKDRSKGTLHSNPSKMARVYKDLNEDVAQANWLEGGIGNALDIEFGKEVAKLATKILSALPNGVTQQHFGFAGLLKAFLEKNAKEKWVKFDDNAKAFATEIAKVAANVQREQGIKALKADAAYANLFFRNKEKAINAGIASAKATAQSVRVVLDALLEQQRKPSKGRWAVYLDLGAGGDYKLKKGGTFQGNKYHLRMSKESWTADADGGVSVATNSVDDIFEKLLSGTANWKQMHATLEVSDNADNNTHVFLIDGVLSNDKKWAAAATLLEKDAAWVKEAQTALKGALKEVADEIKAKIRKAKADDGLSVV
jgi:hypothetical protein